MVVEISTGVCVTATLLIVIVRWLPSDVADDERVRLPGGRGEERGIDLIDRSARAGIDHDPRRRRTALRHRAEWLACAGRATGLGVGDARLCAAADRQ